MSFCVVSLKVGNSLVVKVDDLRSAGAFPSTKATSILGNTADMSSNFD